MTFVPTVTRTHKNSVRLVATSSLNLDGLPIIDGVQTEDGDRILATAQSPGIYNGIWIASSSTWSRAPDMDADNDIKPALQVPVSEGTAYSGSIFQLTTLPPYEIRTTSFSFSEMEAGLSEEDVIALIPSSPIPLPLAINASTDSDTPEVVGGFSLIGEDYSNIDFVTFACVTNSGLTGRVELYNLSDNESVIAHEYTNQSFSFVSSGAISLSEETKLYEIRISVTGGAGVPSSDQIICNWAGLYLTGE